MRVRTYLRKIRQGDGRSIGDVAALTGIAKGEISSFERGHAIPRDDQLEAMRNYYGHPSRWYPATVARALLPDLADCPGCGEELEPDASGSRRYHDDECRIAAGRRRADSSRPHPVA
jgi:transcriptional regulator with XRE-family HTH domain